MDKYTVAVLVGSLRQESFNLKLARALAKLGEDKFDMKFTQIGDLPLYNQDLETSFPAPASRLKNDIINADAVLFVTPEYNRSLPGVLKNAIDWASRPYGKNAFAGKPVAICGTSPGATGTACSQNHLRPVLMYLDVVLMGQPELYLQFRDNLIDSEGNVSNEGTRQFLQKFIDRYAQWVGDQLSAVNIEEKLRRAG